MFSKCFEMQLSRYHKKSRVNTLLSYYFFSSSEEDSGAGSPTGPPVGLAHPACGFSAITVLLCYNWIPDVQHSSVAATALQRMLLQDVDDKIVLLPAWPDDWNCDFKLYAKQNTTVEGKVELGKLVELIVKPETRKKDVYIGQELTKPDESIWK